MPAYAIEYCNPRARCCPLTDSSLVLVHYGDGGEGSIRLEDDSTFLHLLGYKCRCMQRLALCNNGYVYDARNKPKMATMSPLGSGSRLGGSRASKFHVESRANRIAAVSSCLAISRFRVWNETQNCRFC